MRPDYDVWARFAWAAVDLHDALSCSPDDLLAGLSYRDHELRRRRHITWTDYCTIVENVARIAGSPTELEDLLEASYHTVVPELRAIAGRVIGPNQFAHFVLGVLDPIFVPAVKFETFDLGDRLTRVVQTLRQGARPCEAYFRGSVGAFRGLTRHLDLPPVEIVSATVTDEWSEMVGRLPESRSLLSRARRASSQTVRWLAARVVFGAEPDGTPLTAIIGEPRPDPIDLRIGHATTEWRLTPRQAQVLSLVAAGRANKEISAELSCAENTTELHVTTLLRKAGVTSRTRLIAQFWAADWELPS